MPWWARWAIIVAIFIVAVLAGSHFKLFDVGDVIDTVGRKAADNLELGENLTAFVKLAIKRLVESYKESWNKDKVKIKDLEKEGEIQAEKLKATEAEKEVERLRKKDAEKEILDLEEKVLAAEKRKAEAEKEILDLKEKKEAAEKAAEKFENSEKVAENLKDEIKVELGLQAKMGFSRSKVDEAKKVFDKEKYDEYELAVYADETFDLPVKELPLYLEFDLAKTIGLSDNDTAILIDALTKYNYTKKNRPVFKIKVANGSMSYQYGYIGLRKIKDNFHVQYIVVAHSSKLSDTLVETTTKVKKTVKKTTVEKDTTTVTDQGFFSSKTTVTSKPVTITIDEEIEEDATEQEWVAARYDVSLREVYLRYKALEELRKKNWIDDIHYED